MVEIYSFAPVPHDYMTDTSHYHRMAPVSIDTLLSSPVRITFLLLVNIINLVSQKKQVYLVVINAIICYIHNSSQFIIFCRYGINRSLRPETEERAK